MSGLLPGFEDVVRDSQAVFRAMMDATARPGRIQTVPGPAATPAPLDRATAAVLLTLTDADTPLWLDARAAAAWEWVSFHCGAPPALPGRAQFAVAIGNVGLEGFGAGSDEEPEGSATVVLQVAALGTGERLELRGPGLEGTGHLLVEAMPAGFRAFWAANGRLFPRGIDVILCAGDRLAALPRTVRVS